MDRGRSYRLHKLHRTTNTLWPCAGILIVSACAGTGGGTATSGGNSTTVVGWRPPRALGVQATASRTEETQASNRGTQLHFVSDLTAIQVLPKVDGENSPTRVLLGNIRAEIAADNTVVLAQERTGRTIVAASQASNGTWLFLATDGLAVASDSFTGPLRRVGENSESVRDSSMGVGAIYYTDRMSQGWLITAEHGQRRWPDEAVVSGAFSNANEGAYVDFAGDLWSTNDGGRSAQRVSLGSQCATTVQTVLNRLRVTTSEGFSALQNTRTLQRLPQPSPEADELTRNQRWALLTAALRRWPQSVWSLTGRAPAALDHPVFAFGRDLVRIDSETGAVRRVYREVLPLDDCSIRNWGERLFLECGAAYTAYLWSEEEGLRPISAPLPRDLLFSDDGTHAVAGQPCEQQVYDREGQSRTGNPLCVLRESSARWTNYLPSGRFARPFALRGSRFIAQLFSQTDMSLRVMDLESDEFEALSFSNSDDQRGAYGAMIARFAPDGTPWAVVAVEPTNRLAAMGRPDYAMARWTDTSQAATAQPLPTGALSIGMQSANEGLAAGVSFMDLWRTTDGGTQWQHLDIPVDGAPGSLAFYGRYGISGMDLPCTADRCLVGPLLVQGHGPLLPSSERILTATTPFVSLLEQQQSRQARMYTPRYYGADRSRYECTTMHSQPAHNAHKLFASGSEIELQVRAVGRNRVSLEGSWSLESSTNRQIPFISGEISLPVATQNPSTTPLDQGWGLRISTENWAFIERCPSSDRWGRCDHVLLSRNAPPAILQVDETTQRPNEDDGHFVAATAFGDHQSALLFGQSTSAHACSSLVLLINDAGTVAHRRHVTCGQNELFDTALAFRGNTLGIVRMHQTNSDPSLQTFRYHPLFNHQGPVTAVAEPLPLLLTNNTGPLVRCPRTTDPRSLVLVGGGNGLRAGVSYVQRYFSGWQAEVQAEQSPSGEWCVRRVHSGAVEGSRFSHRTMTRRMGTTTGALTVHSATSAGEHLLEGTFHDETRIVQIRCVEEQ